MHASFRYVSRSGNIIFNMYVHHSSIHLPPIGRITCEIFVVVIFCDGALYAEDEDEDEDEINLCHTVCYKRC